MKLVSYQEYTEMHGQQNIKIYLCVHYFDIARTLMFPIAIESFRIFTSTSLKYFFFFCPRNFGQRE